MRKKLDTAFIHIGMPKTGSSALQKTFSRFRDTLRANGLLYPNLGAPGLPIGRNIVDTHSALKIAFSGSHELYNHVRLGINSAEAREAYKAEHLARLDEQIDAFGGRTLVLSAETLFGMDEEGAAVMTDYLRRTTEAVKVVCYVRHPVSYRISFGQQQIKVGHKTIEQMERSAPVSLFRKSLEPWLRAVGNDNMIIAGYGRSQLIGGSTQSDFLSRCGYTGDIAALEIASFNEALSMPATIIKSRMNGFASTQDQRIHRREYLFSIPGPRFTLSEQATAAVLRAAQSDLEWLKETFDVEPEAPSASRQHPLPDYFDEATVVKIREVAATPGNFRSQLEREAFEHAMASLRAEGIEGLPTALATAPSKKRRERDPAKAQLSPEERRARRARREARAARRAQVNS